MTELPNRPLRAYADVSLGRQRSPQHEHGPDMVPYLRAANVSDGRLNLEHVNEMNFTPAEQRVFSLRWGDVLVTEGSGSLGSVGASAVWHEDLPGTICFQNTLLRIRPRSDRTDPRFLAWWCRAAFANKIFAGVANGANIFHISAERVRSLPVRWPSVSLQQAIADFLDAETARIDALSRKYRRLIELAAEKLRATVDTATALGTPTHVRRVTSLITSGPRGWSERVGDEGRPFIRSANLQRDQLALRLDNLQFVAASPTAEAKRSQTQPGDTVIGITGANVGWIGLVGRYLPNGYVSQHVALLRPVSLTPEWLAFSLFSQRVQQRLSASQYGGTKQQMGLEDLAAIPIFVPPLHKQAELVKRMAEAADHETRLRRQLGRQVILLQERRQALITAAVTGELNVAGGMAGI